MTVQFKVHSVSENQDKVTGYKILSTQESFSEIAGGNVPEASSAKYNELIGNKIYTVQDVLNRNKYRIGEPTKEEIERAEKAVVSWNKRDNAINQFIEALNFAYDKHYPISLSPDMIWILIAQSLAKHINLNAEELRSKFVSHDGKKHIEVVRNYFIKGSSENDWSSAFDEFSSQIKANIGEEMHKLLTANFSTTTATEKAASEIVLMEAMQNYFSYGIRTSCGFPWIELQGELQDWIEIKNRVRKFGEFGLQDWSTILVHILDEFILAAEGKANSEFWQSFYKVDGGSGGPYITGWVNSFFLYLKRDIKNDFATKLPEKRSWVSEGHNPSDYLLGISAVPFEWKYYGQIFNMEFLAGFCGFTQREDNAIVPVIGWAVRDK